MTSRYEILVGDAKEKLREIPDQSVHCCVTSPPYWNLRDYDINGQIGLEDTPEAFVQTLVEVFKEVHRVLRNDGTLFVVLGDSYAQAKGHGHWESRKGKGDEKGQKTVKRWAKVDASDFGLKPKDLIGIPWKVAFALRDAGYYLRQDLIWAKGISGPHYRGGSCMPEPVRDRCTRSFENVFMFSKSRYYFYDHEAIKEDAVSDHAAGNNFKRQEQISKGGPGSEEKCETLYKKRNRRSVWHVEDSTALPLWLAENHPDILGDFLKEQDPTNVFHVNPQPFKGSHFATFPEALITPMIRAGTSSEGVCSSCGAPWRTCECEETTPVPATVLDPFCGSGTTGLVCVKNDRHFIGVELNPEYAEIAKERIESGILPYVKLFG